jgi:hypothetical protein
MRSSSRLDTPVDGRRDLGGDAVRLEAPVAIEGGGEPHREQLDELAGDVRVGGQRVLDVARAEGEAGLAEVAGVGPQHGELERG